MYKNREPAYNNIIVKQQRLDCSLKGEAQMVDGQNPVEVQLARIYQLLRILEVSWDFEYLDLDIVAQFPETYKGLNWIEQARVEHPFYEARYAIGREIGERINQLDPDQTDLEERIQLRKLLAKWLPRQWPED